jgi:hypothetical protein
MYKEIDDMDGQDWVDFIDEYHCVDYWYDLDSLMGVCDIVDDPFWEGWGAEEPIEEDNGDLET